MHLAYPVPFRLRREPQHNQYVLTNKSDETLYGVDFALHGAGLMSASAPARLDPGDSLAVTVLGDDLAVNTILVIRWFRPDGVEYLWRISF